MNVADLSQKDRDTLRDSLLIRRSEGVENPLIPLNVDLDGDGIVDAFGLDENDKLVLVSGASLTETLYEATGEDDVDRSGDDE